MITVYAMISKSFNDPKVQVIKCVHECVLNVYMNAYMNVMYHVKHYQICTTESSLQYRNTSAAIQSVQTFWRLSDITQIGKTL